MPFHCGMGDGETAYIIMSHYILIMVGYILYDTGI